MDFNFYTNFKQRYDSINEEATRVGGKNFTQLLNEFVWNGDMIDYVKGIIPYPGGINWIGAKRIMAVMNMNNTHFMTLEILLHECRMNVYDCNLTCQLKLMVKNITSLACGSYSLAFIEHLITNTPIQPPNTLLCDNTVGRLQWNWVAGLVDKNFEP
ncbi:hypothetical protein KY290_024842 [Solanum tuberosum]|uniref:Ubiquitin-like protease family profile domain-containing protein n=1 Tax=Solanum tuberosum TaxID=4113 RepID=A0ABQ7URU3_SOLTU|nr:hypothetical protein KY284_023694 [Solanum tuberosum]KAH0754572.1 hypothetical protein KY290_024842 [Solanum tuberosum]